MHANPFASLIDPASAIAIAHRAHRMRNMVPTGWAIPAAFDIRPVEEKPPREYRPTPRTRRMLQALRADGPMSSAELSKRCDVPSKYIYSYLQVALEHGAVRRSETTPIRWEVA